MLSNPNIEERMYWYQLTVPTLPPGGLLNVPLRLDLDAPFSLRSIRTRGLFQSDTGRSDGVRFWLPSGRRFSEAYVSPLLPSVVRRDDAPFAWSYPAMAGLRLWPESVYAPGGVIRCDIENTSGETINNARIIFRGSKYFPVAGGGRPDFPPRGAVFPIVRQFVIRDVAPTGTVMRFPLINEDDAPWVLRGAVLDPFTIGVDGGPVAGSSSSASSVNPALGAYTDLTAQLFDGQGRAFSNEPIPVNELFPQADPYPSFENGGLDDPSFGRIGLFTPELRLGVKQALSISFFRNDSALSGNVNLYLRFHGVKVYEQ